MERIEFLELENRTLNRHKGELIEKAWALESVNRKQADRIAELEIAIRDAMQSMDWNPDRTYSELEDVLNRGDDDGEG